MLSEAIWVAYGGGNPNFNAGAGASYDLVNKTASRSGALSHTFTYCGASHSGGSGSWSYTVTVQPGTYYITTSGGTNTYVTLTSATSYSMSGGYNCGCSYMVVKYK